MIKIFKSITVFWKEFGEDLLLQFARSPKRLHGFAFIVHPRSYDDVLRNNHFFRSISPSMGVWILHRLWPVTVARIEGLRSLENGEAIPGWIIAVPLLARDMFEKRKLSRKRIQQAVRLAKKRGAHIAGLGALTGSFSAGGKFITIKGISITAGRAYTAYTVNQYIWDVIQKFGLSPEKVRIAIVGAGGSVGSGVAKLLLERGIRNLVLIDLERKIDAVRALHEELKHYGSFLEVTHQLSALKSAHIVVTATNAPEAVVHSDDISPGTVIIDDAQPSDIGEDVLMRDDVLAIEAGVINTKGIKYNFNFHLAGKEDSYCCLGEVMALAASAKKNPEIPNEISPESIKTIVENAKRLGFAISEYQYGGKIISEEKIQNVREHLLKRF